MSLSGWLQQVVSGEEATTGTQTQLYECRHCGTTLDAEAEKCHVCSSAEIAVYVLK